MKLSGFQTDDSDSFLGFKQVYLNDVCIGSSKSLMKYE